MTPLFQSQIPESFVVLPLNRWSKTFKENSKTTEEIDKLNAIKEHLRAIKGMSLYDPVKAIKIYLVLDVMVLKKFKLSKFDKCNGM